MKLLLVFVFLVISGCSSIYHKKEGWVPEGYSDQKISETEYLISFQTYRNEDWTKVKDHLLFRAAEIGKLNNYSFFSITDTKKEEEVEHQSMQAVIATQEGFSNSGSAAKSITGPVSPQYVKEYTIRTLSSIATYSNKKKDNEYTVEQVLTDIQVK